MKTLREALQRTMLIEPNEQRAAIASFLMATILMASYFVLRPVRDALASDWSDSEVSLLWNIQFFLSIGVVALYGLAISRLRIALVVPLVYGAFATSFLLFFVATPMVSNPTLLEKGFYLWVAAFSLFNLSVFWSFMSDIFSRQQGKRLFAVIGAGASAGALLGPAIPTLFAAQMGLDRLMLLAALGLFSVIPIIRYLQHQKITTLGNANAANSQVQLVGGAWWQGFNDVIRNPYLLAIAGFLLLYVFIGSFVYFAQKNVLAEFSRIDRVQILGGIDWIVNALTFACALFFTGRLTRRFGMATTLALVPAALVLGMIVLAVAPLVVVLLTIQVIRRVGNYSITRPAREMLFTNVTSHERFKAKPVIDVVVYRGGDAVSGSVFALLTDGIGLGLAAMALIGAGIASLWTSLGILLGRLYQPGAATQRTQQPQNHPTQSLSQIKESL